MIEYNPEEILSPLWKLINPAYPNLALKTCSLTGCEDKGALTCTGCYTAGYCARGHQKEDWKNHKTACSPFKIVSKPGSGRHLIATRNIGPGEVILIDYPVAVGPKQYTAPVCLGCHSPVSLEGYRCSECDWPMCGEPCQNSSIHRAECKLFSSSKVKPTNLRKKTDDETGENPKSEDILEHPMYECITPLRVCLSRLHRPENWEVVRKMETHRALRELDENNFHNNHNVVSFLIKYTKIQQHIANISESDITLASDVLDVNAFEIRGKGGSLRGLYPLTAMMNSSCSPNTQNSIDTDFACTVRAVREIKKGEEICDTYTSTLTNTQYRRKHLQKTKYFGCTCRRCQDTTELGSNFSTLVCRSPGCLGYMFNTNPIHCSAPFRCEKCGFMLEKEKVEQEQEYWENEIETRPRDIHTQEAILLDLYKLYHRNHNMCVDVLFNLVPLYGSSQSPDMVREAERKEELCQTILNTMDRLIPGLFRMRGMMLVELYSTRLFLLRKSLESKKITKPVFVRKLCSERPLLVESQTILTWEPAGSIEHSRLQSVKTFLEQLDDIARQAGKVLTE